MAQRRYRAALLNDNSYGTAYPAPSDRVLDISNVSGGLNLWDLDYKLDPDQSPDCVNMYWKDGSLSSRPGQEYVLERGQYTPAADCYACYERDWHSYLVAHIGTSLYKIDLRDNSISKIYNGTIAEGLGGNFFVFGDKLYYLNGRGSYIQIDKNLQATDVEPYVPLVAMNRLPSGVGGDLYEDENRISSRKRVQFTTDGEATEYILPEGYKGLDDYFQKGKVEAKLTAPEIIEYQEALAIAGEFTTTIQVEGVNPLVPPQYYYFPDVDVWASAISIGWNTTTKIYNITLVTTTVSDDKKSKLFIVDRENAKLTFFTAPPTMNPKLPNNLEVSFSKKNEDAYNSILKCTCVAVYGGDVNLAVVCGGNPAQPNAYFWSGHNNKNLDPSYFPFDYYNFAGNADEFITGFGRQQSMLVIFKERSIGKSYFRTETIAGTDYLKLPYTPVNYSVGCDIENSIKLVENNLVFANKENGVYVLLDTTSAGENTVKRLSRNVNGNGTTRGLLKDLRAVASTGVTSFDDGQRYWLTANGHSYIWDYTLKSINAKEENLSWFYFTNINPIAWHHTTEKDYYFKYDGSLVTFSNEFVDFGEAIERKYTFSTQNFGTYEVLKDVQKVIFAVRSDTDSLMTVTYKTDYETRDDATLVNGYAWKLSPRNLTHRGLRVIPFAGVAVRKPRCFHVRHFSMTLTNNEPYTDMSIISAQIFYRYSRGDR